MNRLRLLKHYLREKYLTRFSDRMHFEKWQQQRLQKALARATQVFPFYQKMLGYHYNQFPIINSQMLTDNFAELNSDPKERARWAGTLLAKTLPGSLLKKRRIAFIFRENHELYTARIPFQFFDLSQPLDILVCALIDFSPDVIIAPAQTLRLLAKYLANHPLRHKVKRIISIAETLKEHDRQYIEQIFKQKIHEIYQTSEGLLLATSCHKGTLHLNENLWYVEHHYVDQKRNRFVPIVTDLFRETQAIIRYRLNDLLVVKKENCDCGSVFQALATIEDPSNKRY